MLTLVVFGWEQINLRMPFPRVCAAQIPESRKPFVWPSSRDSEVKIPGSWIVCHQTLLYDVTGRWKSLSLCILLSDRVFGGHVHVHCVVAWFPFFHVVYLLSTKAHFMADLCSGMPKIKSCPTSLPVNFCGLMPIFHRPSLSCVVFLGLRNFKYTKKQITHVPA